MQKVLVYTYYLLVLVDSIIIREIVHNAVYKCAKPNIIQMKISNQYDTIAASFFLFLFKSLTNDVVNPLKK